MNRITKWYLEMLERSRSQIEEPKRLVVSRDEMSVLSGPYNSRPQDEGKNDWKLWLIIAIVALILIATTTSWGYLWVVRPQ